MLPKSERTLLWNDPAIGIEWPGSDEPDFAARSSLRNDEAGKLLSDADTFE